MRRLAADDVWEDLGVREYDVLHTLSRRPGGRARLGTLSEEVYLPQPSLSRLVDRLERHGLLAREPDPGDRRGVLVALTDEGAARQRRIGGRHAASIARHLGEMEAGELADLTRLARAALDRATASATDQAP
nr:MarR family transcriptional regulator [Kineococcus siccus]